MAQRSDEEEQLEGSAGGRGGQHPDDEDEQGDPGSGQPTTDWRMISAIPVLTTVSNQENIWSTITTTPIPSLLERIDNSTLVIVLTVLIVVLLFIVVAVVLVRRQSVRRRPSDGYKAGVAVH